VPAAFSFLRETSGRVTWTTADLARTLRITPGEAKNVTAVLELQGYIKPHGSEWMTTIAGEQVSDAKPPRFTREAVEKALEDLQGRIEKVDRDPKAPYRVTEAVAFGDFLSGQPRVQAADVGVQLTAKGRAAGESSAQERAAQDGFLRELRARSAILHIMPYESWMSRRAHRRLI
jgi:Mn-dependent DtxR family transcriptional regulator